MPQAAFFCCQQHAPQYFWKAEYQSHANGADKILEVIMVAESPETFSGFFSKLQDPDSVVIGRSELTIHTPRGTIRVITPAEAGRRYGTMDLAELPESPHFLGFSVQTSDLDFVVEHLRKNSIPYENSSQLIRLHPKDAFGVLIEFRK
jgi:hypothetical protein